MKIGELLISKNIINREQLRNAVIYQIKNKTRIGHALVDLNYCTWEQVARILSRQFNLPYIDISKKEILPKILYLIPPELMREHRFIGFDYRERITNRPLLSIAFADPNNIIALDEIRLQTGCELQVFITEEDKIEDLLLQIQNRPPLYFEKKYTLENVTKQMLVLDALTADLTPHKQLTIIYRPTSQSFQRTTSQRQILKDWPVIRLEDLKSMANECFDIHEIPLLSKKGRIGTFYTLPGMVSFKIALHDELFPQHFEPVRFNFNFVQMSILRQFPSSK